MVGLELPTTSRERRHQAGEGYSGGKYFEGRAQDTGDRESHQDTKGKQGNTQETQGWKQPQHIMI